MSITIVVFLEGSPGHEKQSLAVAGELRNILPEVTIRKIQLEKKGSVQRIGQHLMSCISPRRCLPNDDLGIPDLLLGTGSATHPALLAAKKIYDVPAVTCMAPDCIIRSRFDLCLVPRHDRLAPRKNLFMTDGPPVLTTTEGEKKADRGLILLGGVIPHNHDWSTPEIIDWVMMIAEKDRARRWTVSSSPRTPDHTCQALAALAAHKETIDFFHYKETPRGWVEERYRESSVVWVTADSMSMIYEALTAGCKVGLLPLRWRRQGTKYQRSMGLLVARGLVVDFASWQSGEIELKTAVGFNEARRCAEEIRRRWFTTS